MKNVKLNDLKVWIGFLIIIVPAIVLAILDKAVLLGVMLVPSFMAAVFLNMNKFKTFKAGEFEAELRDFIEEANLTIDQLKEMTVPLLDYSLANVISDNRTFMGVAASDKEQFYTKALENIEKFNIESENTQRLLKSVRNEIAVSYLLEVEIESEKWGGMESNKAANNFFSSFDLENAYLDSSLLPSVSDIRRFYDGHPLLNGEKVRQKIDQYEKFLNAFIREG